MFVLGAWTAAASGETFTADSPAHLPFGGRAGAASGIGRVGGNVPMESFTELQTVVVA